ncbi:MAG: 4Fe-4S dicluster domain-containing protein [Xanthobacteraceae bacterium]
MSNRWNLLVDVEKCTGCRNCFVAVKDEYVGNSQPGYFASQPLGGHAWFNVGYRERGATPFTEVSYVPMTCQHCDDAPCIKTAKNGAVSKRPDGIVLIDPERAIGQKAIAEACPYGAISWNETLQLPQAWPFDAHLLDSGWSRTRAEQVCPTGALKSAKLADSAMQERAEKEGWRALRPELATRPRIYYRGLHRVETILVAGSIEAEQGGALNCLEGATIELIRNGNTVATAATDDFGDFKIDHQISGGTGIVQISADGYRPLCVEVDLRSSISIGRRRLIN